MAHSFENFMGNKGFHPASWTNQKKVCSCPCHNNVQPETPGAPFSQLWEAEQRQKQEEMKQEALRLQYLKEQELYQTK